MLPKEEWHSGLVILALLLIHILSEDRAQRYTKQNWKIQIYEQWQQESERATGKATWSQILIKDFVPLGGRKYRGGLEFT